MKTFYLSGILLSALLPIGAAEARPADCLVVLEGRTYIDGQCDFQAENGGDFTIRQGSRTARVSVDPGSREGRASFEDASPRNPQALVWDVRRQGACWVDGSSRICAWDIGQRPQAQGGGQGGGGQGFGQAPQQWSPPPQAQAPQQWSPPPQAQQMPPQQWSPPPQAQAPQQPATRMIRMDSAPGRFSLAREMQGNRMLRCVVQGPPDEGLRVSYYPNTSGRRAFSIPGNRAPDGTQDTLTVTLIPGNGRPAVLQARHNGGRVAADLPEAISTKLSDATTMEVQFGSTGETRSFDLSTYGEVEPAVDGCLTSFGPSQDDAIRQAERDYQRQQQAQRPAPPPPVAYAPPAQQGSGQVFRFPFTRAGAWEIRRLTDQPDGRRTTGCVVDSNDQALRNVRFAVDGGNAIIDFRDGGDLRRLPRRFQVQIQFGTNTRSYTFPAEVVDEGFGPWIRLMTARNFQSGIENADQLIIRTPSGLVTLPLFDGDRLWPAMARCIAAMR